MGVIFSRVRKKKSTIETLEKLENEIKEMEESRTNAQRKYKKITKLLLMYSVGLYVLCGLIFYFQFTSTIKGKLLYLVPLAISPLLLYIIKRIISWYFVRVINKNQIRLNEMKKEKKRILEEVMDKETYKVAKQILDKFSSETGPKSNYNVLFNMFVDMNATAFKFIVMQNDKIAITVKFLLHQITRVKLAPIREPNDGLRRRIVSTSSSNSKTQFPSSMKMDIIGSQTSRPFISSPVPSRALPGSVTSMLHLPAPILPLHRNYVDRVVEYLIGDGPNNRYALICSQCHSHNGMALKEEFEYLGFKCCYCFFFNPARKLRPEAPRLENSPKIKQESSSESEKTSEENSDSEPKTSIGYSSTDIRETSDVKNSVESSTDKRNDEAPEENASDVTESAENYSEETKELLNFAEVKSTSNQPENDVNCDQSLIKI